MLLNALQHSAKINPKKIAIIDAHSKIKVTYDEIIQIFNAGKGYYVDKAVGIVISIGEPTIHDLPFLISIGQSDGVWIPLADDDHIKEIVHFFSNENILIIEKNGDRKYLKKSKKEKTTKQEINPPFLITFSSGTTGVAKGIILSQSKKLERIKQSISLFGLTGKDTIISNSPIYHSMGQKLLFTSLKLGATLVRNVPFSPAVWMDACQTYQPSFGIPVSTQMALLKETKENYLASFFSFRAIVMSSASASIEFKKHLLKQKIDIWETFGCSEAAFISASKITVEENDHVGGLIDDVEIKINSENSEILVKTPYLCDGYFNGRKTWESALTSDKFFKTGDIGEIRGKKLFFRGRLGLEFLIGPYKVNPIELEFVVKNTILNSEVVIVPVENSFFSNTIGMYLKKNGQACNEVELYDDLKNLLPKHLLPTKIKIIESWPLLPNGKIDRQRLIQRMNNK